MDLGHLLYRKNYYFSKFSVHQLLVNPQVKGYPPIFLICRDQHGHQRCEYIIGLNFNQLNALLMQSIENHHRLIIAEKLSDFLLSDKKTAEFSIQSLLGMTLVIDGLDLQTRVRKFQTEPSSKDRALYYFQPIDL